MAALLDPLRNTLDHLALDPKARDDRKYLVSMLRRLGYSDREIEAALGWEGDEARIIEVEYEPPGERPLGGFTVVEGWEEPQPSSVGFSVAREGSLPAARGNGQARQWVRPSDPAIAFGWKPDSVDFAERPTDGKSEALAWADAEDTEAAEVPWPETGADEAWLEPAEAGDETAWPETDEAARTDAPPEGEWQVVEEDPAEAWEDQTWAEPESWQPVEEPMAQEQEAWTDESDRAWAETDDEQAWTDESDAGTQTQWDEAPQESWAEPAADDASGAWEKAPETPWEGESWDDQWDADQELAEPAPQWEQDYAIKEPPAGSWQPASQEPFTYEEYTLFTRMVELSTGREQRIYFFAKNEPKSGSPCPLPSGYIVERNERTGLPFLRRDPDVERVEAPAETPEQEEAEELECLAVTKAGSQCRNAPRQGSKYCAVHRGWRGPRAA